MREKMILYALAVISAAIWVVPAGAVAGTPEIECGNVACGNLAVDSGETVLSTTSNLTVTCTGSSGSGTFASKVSGTIELTFTGCKESVFGTSCTNTGTAGKITSTILPFDNTYVGADNKTTPGVLVTPATPASEHYATFTCVGGTVTEEVKGNGLMARLTSPSCGGSASTLSLVFQTTAHGQQTYKQITETGNEYDLRTNGTTSALRATDVLTLSNSATVTCV